jgi:hypothetical protein
MMNRYATFEYGCCWRPNSVTAITVRLPTLHAITLLGIKAVDMDTTVVHVIGAGNSSILEESD